MPTTPAPAAKTCRRSSWARPSPPPRRHPWHGAPLSILPCWLSCWQARRLSQLRPRGRLVPRLPGAKLRNPSTPNTRAWLHSNESRPRALGCSLVSARSPLRPDHHPCPLPRPPQHHLLWCGPGCWRFGCARPIRLAPRISCGMLACVCVPGRPRHRCVARAQSSTASSSRTVSLASCACPGPESGRKKKETSEWGGGLEGHAEEQFPLWP
jgi:hypothetical protein